MQIIVIFRLSLFIFELLNYLHLDSFYRFWRPACLDEILPLVCCKLNKSIAFVKKLALLRYDMYCLKCFWYTEILYSYDWFHWIFSIILYNIFYIFDIDYDFQANLLYFKVMSAKFSLTFWVILKLWQW